MNEVVDFRSLGSGGERALSPGELLTRGRQAQNFTSADVARQLKLSVWQIEALEAGQYHRLPGPIFVRGFIRNYARLVKLNPDELLQAAGDSIPPALATPETPPSQDIPFPSGRTSRQPAMVAGVVAVVAVLVGYEFYWSDTGSTVTEPDRVVSRPNVANANAVATRPLAAPAVARERTSAAATAKAAPVAMPRKEAPAAQAGSGSETGSLPRPGERQVHLVFGDESWVEIRDRNERVIFSQLNRPGTRQSVNGLPPFSIVVGNAHGVRLTYDDRQVDLAPHTKIDVARLILQ